MSKIVKLFSCVPICQIDEDVFKNKISFFGIKFSFKRDVDKITSRNYTRKLSELQKKFGKQKIKVGFLINDQAKWQFQSLYEELDKSNFFEPVVLVTELILAHQGKKIFYKTIEDCFNFFKSKKLNVRYVYDRQNKRYLDPSTFDVDILFYQQPWELDKSQMPSCVSKFALTCYVPYGLHLVEFDGSYMKHFHQLLWLMFVENDGQIQRFSRLVKQKVTNCKIVGYPKLDAYFENAEKTSLQKEKPLIIYAPHHSFEANILECATFQHNGLKILDIAKKYKDQIDWVFKPHPRFKTAVVLNNIMTESEIEDYYSAWRNIGTIYDSGDYIGIFRQSDGMITDCISFLGEYLPSGKPLFHLLAEKQPFNEFAKSFIDAYYKIYDAEELDNNLQKVIIEQKDEKINERLAKIDLLFDKNEKASAKIVREMTKCLEGLECK